MATSTLARSTVELDNVSGIAIFSLKQVAVHWIIAMPKDVKSVFKRGLAVKRSPNAEFTRLQQGFFYK